MPAPALASSFTDKSIGYLSVGKRPFGWTAAPSLRCLSRLGTGPFPARRSHAGTPSCPDSQHRTPKAVAPSLATWGPSIGSGSFPSSASWGAAKGSCPRNALAEYALCPAADAVQQHGKRGEHGLEIGLRFTEDDFAATIGVSRQSLNRELRGLEAEGIITLAYSRIGLRDVDSLRAAATDILG